MSTIERAIEIAAKAHAGQVDKAGHPYVFHPLRMMLRVAANDERIVAVLHDVVEDTSVTLDDLRSAGFSEGVVAAVDALTKRPGETYDASIRRAAADPTARRVKQADLEDNLDLSRIPAPTERDRARLDKYRRAIALLQGSTHEVLCIEWEAPDPDIGASGDGYSLHLTHEDATRFISDFWASKPDLTYKEFGVPTTTPYLVVVPDDVYMEIRRTAFGVRKFQPNTPPFRRLGT